MWTSSPKNLKNPDSYESDHAAIQLWAMYFHKYTALDCMHVGKKKVSHKGHNTNIT